MRKFKKLPIIIISGTVIAIAIFAFFLRGVNENMQNEYEKRAGSTIFDRDAKPMFARTNHLGNYGFYTDDIPDNFKKLLLEKEDRYFYWHIGINPVSVAKNIAQKAGFGDRVGSSTVTQQLAKILLGQENKRTVKNKMAEAATALALESYTGKDAILKEYANSIYFGNRLQGIQTASIAYFGVTPAGLSDAQIFQLLATISSPTNGNPLQPGNIEQAKLLAKNLKTEISGQFTEPNTVNKNLTSFLKDNAILFELSGYLASDQCKKTEHTTLDGEINGKLRAIISENIQKLDAKKAKHAAALIVSLPNNEILALAGSPDPASSKEGYQINMLNQPRQIGSTVKPFIYLKGFEKGMRPYTLIDDREYKYPAGEGFSIYPENYDRIYHGPMTAHYALANSINVAAAKTLEFVGVDDFGRFIENDLGVKTQQNYSSYQMGIALGAMETDIISLANAFTIFPNKGPLNNFTLFTDPQCNNLFSPKNDTVAAKNIYTGLVNKILSDRAIAQDQFTSASDLNLPATNYALKTGTSHDYTDSWVVGYTPDFLVAVWVGNADSSAMDGVSGQIGAGRIWGDIMQMMIASKYNKKTPFDFSEIAEYKNGNNIEYGLKNDDYDAAKNIIENNDASLILKPHDGDIYRLEDGTRIILKAKTAVYWQINGADFGNLEELIFTPDTAGNYKITATAGDLKEEIEISLVKKQ